MDGRRGPEHFLGGPCDGIWLRSELALETGLPSGRVSVEPVVNELGQLNATPVPQNAETTLQVTTRPLTDTARYDCLRAESNRGSRP